MKLFQFDFLFLEKTNNPSKTRRRRDTSFYPTSDSKVVELAMLVDEPFMDRWICIWLFLDEIQSSSSSYYSIQLHRWPKDYISTLISTESA